MQINKPEMTKILKQQLAAENLTLTDEQINDSFDEAQAMHDQTIVFMNPNKPLLQIMTPAFISGILFALKGFKRETADYELSTKDGGDNFKVTKLS